MVAQIELTTTIPLTRSSSLKSTENKESFKNMKRRLIERKELHFRCRQVNDIMCFVAIFGIILMMVDVELQVNNINHRINYFIRPLISLSTLLLVILVLYYHSLDTRLYAINNHIADWRVTLTIHGIIFIVFEVLVCSIHPFSFAFTSYSSSSQSNGITWLQLCFTLPSK